MKRLRERFRDGFYAGGLAILVLVCVPLIAALAFVARAGILVGAILAATAGIVLWAASPRFREWLSLQDTPELQHNGLRLATDVALAPGHSWARISGREVTVGADDLMASVLGPVDGVELPAAGRQVARGEPLFGLRRGERAIAVRAPVSGRIVGTNTRLLEAPGLVNEAPFGEGWAVRLEGNALRRERRRLLRGGPARAWFRGEVDRLLATLVPGAVAPALPDGGVLVEGLHRHVDADLWQTLVAMFFTEPAERGSVEN